LNLRWIPAGVYPALVAGRGMTKNEKGFMKSACETIFPDKDYLTVEQFIKKLKSTSL